MGEPRLPLNEMIRGLKQDEVDDLEPYLAVALVPLQIMISDSKFPTDADKKSMVKQAFEEIGFTGSLIQSVERVPPGKH